MSLDRGVGAPINDTATALVDLDPIPMSPYARVHLKVARPVSPILGVIPEEQWHGGHRFCNDQFTDLVQNAFASLVEGFYFCAQVSTLDLSGVHGQYPAAPDKGGTQVRPAAD